MKRKLFIAVQIALLSACGTTEIYREPVEPEKTEIVQEYDSMDQLFDIETESLDIDTDVAREAIFTDDGFESLNVLEVSESGVDLSALNDPTVYFEFDSYELSNESQKTIEKHVKLLTELDNIKVILEGHTDEVGDRAYNLKLSEKRALAVKDFIVSKGVNPERIEVIAYGEEKIIVEREDIDGYGRNRRAEFVYQ